MVNDDHSFHLFVSYTRAPDAGLAQEVERFLESFHSRQPTGQAEPLPPLRVCVDGSDFSMPPVAEPEGRVREILDVVYAHLARARELLVLCSSGAARSAWVDKEIRWFVEHRGVSRVRIAFTEGAVPQDEAEAYIPAAVIEHGLLKGLAYDLRGYDQRRAGEWQQVADFSREMVRLAADLHRRSAGELYPSWLEAELERARRQSAVIASNARFETFAGDPTRAVLSAYQAHQLYPTDASEEALRDAYRVAVLHHNNRRQIAQITGSGSSYLASRWKQGGVFVRTSIDGRFRLLVTERGRDGSTPPGDVFLLNNETLGVVRLAANGPSYRVEDVAFDRATRRVFVTRYFNLYVYGLDGEVVGEYPFSRHTKSPVHLVDGFFDGRWILGAETKGGVWLVDPGVDHNATITVHNEFYGDATVMTDMSPDGHRMTLVYESGQANLLDLNEKGEPRLRQLAEAGILYAGFPTASDGRVIMTGRNGALYVLEIEAEGLQELLRVEDYNADLDWVSWDRETNRFALVGGDRKIHIADADTGLRIATVDYEAEVDWRDAISVPVSHALEEPGNAWEPGEGVAFPDPDLAVSAIEHAGGETWVITEEWPNEYWATHRVHLLREGRAHLFAEGDAPISEPHGMVMLGGSQRLYTHVSGYLRPFPSDGGSIACVLSAKNGLWVGTDSGAFRRQDNTFERITPPSVRIWGLAEIDGSIWMSGPTGAYAFSGERLMRVTDPFLHVSSVRKAGGRVWVLGESVAGKGGSAWRIDRWLASAVPDRDTRISQLFETRNAVWLTGRSTLYRIRGDAVDEVATELEVSALQSVGRSIWCTTKQPELTGGSGSLLRIDAETLEVQVFDLVAPLLGKAGGVVFVIHVVDPEWQLFDMPMGRRAIACLDKSMPRPVELGEAVLQRVTEHRGVVWLLTSVGAFTLEAGRVMPVAVPPLSYTGLVSRFGSTWLYATTAAVRIRGGKVAVFDTGHAVRDLLRVRGETWILTSDGENGPGPAYRVDGRKVTARAPGGAGVASVVDYDGVTWLLTRRQNRSGPMVRADR